jgi:hypothetical protein
MAIEANIVYLEEDIKNNQDRLSLLYEYLRDNPSVSIYCRKIKGKKYYYKKYWQDGKSISKYLSNKKADYNKALIELKQFNKKRRQVKKEYQRLKKVIASQKQQLKVARRVLKND